MIRLSFALFDGGTRLLQGIRTLTLFDLLEDYVEDPRADRVVCYPLDEILLIVFAGLLWGARNFERMVDMAEDRLEWLRRYLPFTNKIPTATTLRRIMRVLDPDRVHEAFTLWMKGVVTELQKQGVAIDGKVLRGSKDDNGKRTDIISAVLHTRRLVLAQLACDKESNEITAVPDLLDLLDLKGTLVTMDAGLTQVAILNQITDEGGDFLVPVKANRETDYKAIEKAFAEYCGEHTEPDGILYAIEYEKSHGRRMIRQCWAQLVPEDFEGLTAISKVSVLAKIRSTRIVKDKRTVEDMYLIASRDMTAQEVITARRGHWAAIENGLHNVLDVTFKEDASRMSADHSAENVNAIRHAVYNTLRELKFEKERPFESKMCKCAGDQNVFDRAMEIAFGS